MPVTHTYQICGETFTEKLSIGKAARKNCLDCTGNSTKEVKECVIVTCPLYPFRFGKDPGRSRNLTEAQKKAVAKRLKKAREDAQE